MNLYAVTGNADKLLEIQEILPEVAMAPIPVDVPEIQSSSLTEIVQRKFYAARERLGGYVRPEDGLFVEDVSLELDFLSVFTGFPGPNVKWMLKAMGAEGIAALADKYPFVDRTATARCLIGYGKGEEKVQFFNGEVKGLIVKPRGSGSFGFDPIFKRDGYHQTFAEMPFEERVQLKHRTEALKKLSNHIWPGSY